ncbi:PQQ-binding-like beta-propeller repeat protein [Halorarius litoreus]|uniref:outer membrane protein assembly factor BamB family protein n=1 Tax=Halorarius litoreus TaxID=2962676 RepID=UPI0020CE9BFE|nr:PQQ-binding-like beta-propeller repeat protein [Halorarius litoreus]
MPSRRAFLGVAGAATLAATSGCTALSNLTNPLRSHVLHEEAPIDALEGPWPTHAADPARTGAVTDERAPAADAQVYELTSIGRYADSQPAIAGTHGFLGVDRREFDGTEFEAGEFTGLVALDLTTSRPGDELLWRAPEGGPSTPFTPSVRGRVVYAPVGEGVKALNAATGDVYWRTNAGGLTPTVDGRDCFTVGGDDGVVALDASTGETRWRSEATAHSASGFAVTDDAVFLACGDGGDGSLWAFERADGATRWRYLDLGESYATAVADSDRAYAVSTGGQLHAVGQTDGERRWTYRVDGDSYIQPAVADGTVYLAGTNSDWLVALEAETGDPVWRRVVGVGGTSPPTVTADSVLVVTRTREGERLLVLDREDGSETARIELPRGMYDSVQPVVADGVAYVVAEPAEDTQSYLYALR